MIDKTEYKDLIEYFEKPKSFNFEELNDNARYVQIKDISAFEGKLVKIKGWMYDRRQSGKNIVFLQMRDGTGRVQATAVQEEGILEWLDIILLQSTVYKAPGRIELLRQQIVKSKTTADKVKKIFLPYLDNILDELNLINYAVSNEIEVIDTIKASMKKKMCVLLENSLNISNDEKSMFLELDEILRKSLFEGIRTESSMEIIGYVKRHPKRNDVFELDLKAFNIISLSQIDYPITPKEHGIDFLMEHRHLWLRSPRQIAILRVRAQVERAILDYLDGNGFTRVDAPILTPASVEGTTTLFETDYFGEKAYLSQSGQLYMEAAAMAMGKVYCFGPTFRAEKSKTRRHVTEFWMVEPEVAFFTLDENMALQEDLICFVLDRVLDKCQDELKTVERDTKPLEAIHKPFPRLHYRDAAQMLADAGFSDFVCGGDLGAEHETYLSTHPCFGGQPVFLHHFPAQCKAFYMQPDPAEPQYSESVDLLAPEGVGEIIGGSMRIHDLALLEQRIKEHNLPPEPLQWYLDLRRYGSVPHGGFGLGITRTVGWICGLRHIREALPFPRTMTRIYP